MPPKPLLSQKEAVSLVTRAAEDFPGLAVLLEPVLVPRPLTADLYIAGWILIVAGPRCTSPWFEMTSPLAYDDLYERVYEHYQAEIAHESPDDEDTEADEPLLVEGVTPLSVLHGKKTRRPTPKTAHQTVPMGSSVP
jgi:hypothetical protein